MDYFQFYRIPLSFHPDPEELKRLFYENSRLYHPDRFTRAPEEAREQALELSSLNNEAYQVLSDPDRRMRYILQIKGLLEEGATPPLPQDFLMDMMDINEALMELEMEPDPGQAENIRNQVAELEAEMNHAIAPILASYGDENRDQLLLIRDYFLKKRYLLRIKENLNKFAPL